MRGAPGVVASPDLVAPPKPCLFPVDGARGGGAIIAASGSRGAVVASACSEEIATTVVGGGAIGFTRSSGLSPGKTHTFRFSS